MDRNWSVFVHLVDEHDIVVAQRDTYPGLGLLPTTLASPGQTWKDRYVIRVPMGAYPSEASSVQVGLYDVTDGYRLQLSDGREALTLAGLPIVARISPVPNPLGVNFAKEIELAGYAVDTRLLSPDAPTLTLTLYWRGLRPLTTNYSVFTHIRGEGESLWAQHDSWPREGSAPTTGWIAGQVISDTHRLTLRPETPPGVYDIEVGVYDPETNRRLQIRTPDGRWVEDFAYLARVRVIEGAVEP